MESFSAHPVPQNVTNFEFHLVGDMTLKQFGYLASGLGSAYIVFVLPGFVTSFPFLAWPLIVIFAAVGAAFAFLPIQERPLDHWVAAFVKAISKPTKLKFESKVLPAEDPLFAKRLNFYLATHKTETIDDLPVSPKAPVLFNFDSGSNPGTQDAGRAKYELSNQTTQTFVSHEPPKLPSSSPQILPPVDNQFSRPDEKIKEVSNLSENEQLSRTVELAKEAQTTQSEILLIEKTLGQIKSTAATPGVDPKTYVTQFESVLTDLQKLNEKASSLSHELAVLTKTKTAPTQTSSGSLSNPQTAPKPSPVMELTTFPNVINGIVIDSHGSYVEGAVVVAHDKQGLPVRALKSNKLGQFIAATPLPGGSYAISAEKEGLQFDSAQIELTNNILKPVVISAKKIDPVIR